jgi:hypothetical protein
MNELLKPSQALMLVKGMLPMTYDNDLDNSPYICDNIRELHLRGKISELTRSLLTAHIRVLLDDAFCLKSWLLGNKHITYEQLKDDLEKNDGMMLQYTRQNWLNDMVFYFQSKGM